MQKVFFGQTYEVPENSSVELGLYLRQHYLQVLEGGAAAVGCEVSLFVTVGHINIPGGKWKFTTEVSLWRPLRGSKFPQLKRRGAEHAEELRRQIPVLQPALFGCYLQSGLNSEDVQRELVSPLQKLGWKA